MVPEAEMNPAEVILSNFQFCSKSDLLLTIMVPEAEMNAAEVILLPRWSSEMKRNRPPSFPFYISNLPRNSGIRNPYTALLSAFESVNVVRQVPNGLFWPFLARQLTAIEFRSEVTTKHVTDAWQLLVCLKSCSISPEAIKPRKPQPFVVEIVPKSPQIHDSLHPSYFSSEKLYLHLKYKKSTELSTTENHLIKLICFEVESSEKRLLYLATPIKNTVRQHDFKSQ